MASHTYHPHLPGYHAGQILHDGCPECEARGKDLVSAFAHMDGPTFERAWTRARAAYWGGEPLFISRAEYPLLQALWAIQNLLQERGPARMADLLQATERS